MCGLVGIYSSNMTMKHKDALTSLLYLDTWRGRDSTGVAALRHNADTDTFKRTVPGYEFVEGPALNNHLKLNDFCWIGHNRAGTVGKNIKSNAHPFEILDEDETCLLVGAHNGTLKNKHVLDNNGAFGTDSEALFHNIAHNGLKETLAKTEGAWALTYYDHVEEELCLIRNEERPLCYMWEKGRKTLIWASEAWMLRIVAGRHGIEIEEDNIYSIPVDTLFKFPVPLKMNDEITVVKKGGVTGKAPAFFPAGQRATGTTSGQGTQQQATQTTGPAQTQGQLPVKARAAVQAAQAAARAISNTVSGTVNSTPSVKLLPTSAVTSNTQQGSAESNVVDLIARRLYKGFAGVKYSFKEISDQLSEGCSWCETEELKVNSAYGWLGVGKPVCHKCLTGEMDKPISVSKNGTIH